MYSWHAKLFRVCALHTSFRMDAAALHGSGAGCTGGVANGGCEHILQIVGTVFCAGGVNADEVEGLSYTARDQGARQRVVGRHAKCSVPIQRLRPPRATEDTMIPRLFNASSSYRCWREVSRQVNTVSSVGRASKQEKLWLRSSLLVQSNDGSRLDVAS